MLLSRPSLTAVLVRILRGTRPSIFGESMTDTVDFPEDDPMVMDTMLTFMYDSVCVDYENLVERFPPQLGHEVRSTALPKRKRKRVALDSNGDEGSIVQHAGGKSQAQA